MRCVLWVLFLTLTALPSFGSPATTTATFDDLSGIGTFTKPYAGFAWHGGYGEANVGVVSCCHDAIGAYNYAYTTLSAETANPVDWTSAYFTSLNGKSEDIVIGEGQYVHYLKITIGPTPTLVDFNPDHHGY